MRRRTALSAFAVVGMLLTACGHRPQCDCYDFDFQKPLDYRQLVFRSSMIISGTVRSVSVIRSGVPARKAPELLLDETQVDVDVENVLRGDWSMAALRFVFFGFSPKNRGGYSGPPPYRVGVGERRLFFLTTDSGQFRSAADVRGDYTIRVWSGAHRGFRRSESPKDAVLGAYDFRAVGDDISAMLLESGGGADGPAMANSLGLAAMVSDELTTRKQTVARLSKLTMVGQDQQLRFEACKLLAEQYAGQSRCLLALEEDPTLSANARQRVVGLRASRKKWDERLKLELRTQPMFAFHIDSVVAVRDELELLVNDADPELRRLACAVYRQNFPGTLVGCGAQP